MARRTSISHVRLLVSALSISVPLVACDGSSDGDDEDGNPIDTGVADVQKPDGGPADTGAPDSGPADMGTPDGAAMDTGVGDSGVPDGATDGGGDGGVTGLGVLFRAFDLGGGPLEGATVQVSGQTHTIGPDGVAFIAGLAGSQVFTVSQPNFTTTSFAFDIPATTRVQIDVNLHPLGPVTPIDDATMSMIMGNGVIGIVTADSIETTGGADVTGTFSARLRTVDLSSLPETLAAPFPFVGVDSNGLETPIAALAVFEIDLSQNGTPLRPKAGQSVQLGVTVPMPFVDLVQPNDVVPAWSYDPTIGRWVEEFDGMVTQGGFGLEVWSGAFDHFSWWMIGVPFSPTCVDTSVESGGAPVEGALVRAIGTTYGYAAGRFTDNQGATCLSLRPNGTAALRAIHESYASMQAPIDVTSGPVPAACGGVCGQASLELVPPACVSGQVLDEIGGPYEDAIILVDQTNACGQPVASNARSDAAGAYCALGPQGAPVTVTAKDATSSDSEAISLFSFESNCANCAPIRQLILGDAAACFHGLAQENRGPMPPAQAAEGTPIYVYSSDVLPSCQTGMDQPAMWGTLETTGMVGPQGMFCMPGVPFGTAFALLGNCSHWLSDQCGPNIAVFNLGTRAVCGQPACVDAGTLQYFSACGN